MRHWFLQGMFVLSSIVMGYEFDTPYRAGRDESLDIIGGMLW